MSILAGSALGLYGLKRRDAGGLLVALLGGLVAQRGLTGHCQVYAALGVSTAAADREGAEPPNSLPRALEMSASATLNVPPGEAYERWHRFEDHPRFMHFIERVQPLDEQRSHWVARGPTGMRWEWESELTEDRPGERIAWRSLEGSDLPQIGSIEFRPAPGNRGTEVHLRLRIDPPLGPVGLAIGRLLGDAPDKMLRDDLRRFKQLVETGEVATTSGQPAARS